MEKSTFLRRMLAIVLCLTMVLPYLPDLTVEVSGASIENYGNIKDFSGLNLSVIGDSISTYEGVNNSKTYNPLYLSTAEATFGTYYGDSSRSDYAEYDQVTRADTWWQQTCDTLGMNLLVNNAWSGSFVVKDPAKGNSTEYPAAAYKNRAVNLHNGSTKPDIIAVYLGTNDVGNYSTVDVGSKADVDTASERNALYTSVNSYATPSTSVGAYYIMLSRMIATYPDAEIYCMLPTFNLSEQASGRATALKNFNAGVTYLTEHFQSIGKKVYLVDLDQKCGMVNYDTVKDYYYANDVHPDCAGMDMITTCLISDIMKYSTLGTGESTFHEVSYDLTQVFPAAGLARMATEGQSLTVDMLPYESWMDVEISVTMTDAATGKTATIPSDGVVGHSVYIPEVTGPVSITAKAVKHDNFHWAADSAAFSAVAGPGFTYNRTTLTTGTYTGSTDSGSFTNVQYALDKPVVLEHHKPWVLEYKGGGTYAGGILLMCDTAASTTTGNLYIHFNQTYALFGYRDGTLGYCNSGISWATIASKMGSSAGANYRSEIHTYRFVNVPNGTENQIYLYVDGVKIGSMDDVKLVGTSTTHASASSVNVSGKDFTFNYIGSTTHPLRNCSINYIKVWERHPRGSHQRW